MSESNLFPLTEAAERTGLTVDALRKRIRRGKLETVKGNDGLVRVRLTAADMDALRLAEGQPSPSQPSENDWIIKALQADAVTLRERTDKAEARADRAEAEREAARIEAATERTRAAQAEAAREAARIAAAAAEGEAKGLQVAVTELREALAEARRPFWRRWIG